MAVSLSDFDLTADRGPMNNRVFGSIAVVAILILQRCGYSQMTYMRKPGATVENERSDWHRVAAIFSQMRNCGQPWNQTYLFVCPKEVMPSSMITTLSNKFRSFIVQT